MGTRELLTFVSAAIGLMALAIDAMLPAFGEMRVSFGLEPGSTSIGQTLTAFFAGIAVAQLIWGPLTDRYGRRPILYAGLIVYVLGAAASALAPSLGALTAARFLWGVGAGGPRVVVTAIVRDTHVGEDMARAMSRVMAVFILVPIIAPSAGAAVLLIAPWQTIFWLCGAAANGRMVTVLGLERSLRLQSVAMTATAVVLVTVTAAGAPPNFFVFHVALAATVGSYMMISPNLSAAGMVPMGDMAGTASSVISASRLGFGALIAAVASGAIGDSLIGFAAATAVFAGLAALVSARSMPRSRP